MRRKYLNTTGMGATTAAYMNQNQTIWAGNKAVTDTMAQVNAALGTVDAKAQAQETPIVGDEELKVLTRHDYEDEIMRIAGQVCSMATKAGDTVTAGQTEFTLSQLDKMSADDLERASKRVSGLATASLAGLADYNITQTDVTGLDGMTAQFDKVKTGPRTAIATRASQTKTLPPAVKSVVSLLRNHLDKQMLMFKKSNPEFYAGYLSARVVIDRHGKGKAKPTPTPTPATPAK